MNYVTHPAIKMAKLELVVKIEDQASEQSDFGTSDQLDIVRDVYRSNIRLAFNIDRHGLG
jgi:hypothetical protein